ncbi:MAG: adenine deaminase, partial [Bacteroidia bacterium]|nr:adenine deaminase [Bacteroidia bacterium]
DAHVHVESSLLAPSEFARMALTHGTIASVSDPHEIANVLGKKGVEYMLENAKHSPFYFYFGAPSCVPATVFETAGDALLAEDVDHLLARTDIYYLSEMMNYPGVLFNDPEIAQKIAAAKKWNKPVDGHAPGLSGADLKKYITAGISTDHECFTLEEAQEKLELGMRVLIREGSAAKNFDALIPLLDTHYEQLMFCSDDKHPDSLLLGHINQLAARAVALGNDVFKVLQVACLNAAKHYKTKHGLLHVGHSADFILVEDLQNFNVLETYIHGKLVAKNQHSLLPYIPPQTPNIFLAEPIHVSDLSYVKSDMEPVIECIDGQLITRRLDIPASDCTAENDCLKLVVYNRYQKAKPAIAYIKNFGLKLGAIAGSVAHDSHNIIAVGISDEMLVKAINLVIKSKGALVACSETKHKILELPIAGLMSDLDAWQVAERYTEVDKFSKQTLSSGLKAPFMSLSFMALLVIPELKLSDLGLFSGKDFSFVRQN